MFKSIVCLAIICFAVVSAGIIETQHVVHEPVLANVGSVIHSAPSAVSHQSFTRFHNKAVVESVVAPVVKTTVHEAPVVSVVKSEPIVHTYAAAAPVVHSLPVVHAAAPLVHSHSVPFVHSAPVAYTVHH